MFYQQYTHFCNGGGEPHSPINTVKTSNPSKPKDSKNDSGTIKRL